jgi:hypothetical protein
MKRLTTTEAAALNWLPNNDDVVVFTTPSQNFEIDGVCIRRIVSFLGVTNIQESASIMERFAETPRVTPQAAMFAAEFLRDSFMDIRERQHLAECEDFDAMKVAQDSWWN